MKSHWTGPCIFVAFLMLLVLGIAWMIRQKNIDGPFNLNDEVQVVSGFHEGDAGKVLMEFGDGLRGFAYAVRLNKAGEELIEARHLREAEGGE